MAKQTLENWLTDLDAYAADHPSGAYEVYAAQSLYLAIWTGKGCIPDPAYHPGCVPELEQPARAMLGFDTTALKLALTERMATSWTQAASWNDED